jgi:hypothetical protein
MDKVEVSNSSHIAAYQYHEEVQILSIWFKNSPGTFWNYTQVPKDVYERFEASDSKGKFFHAEFKNAINEDGSKKYPATKIAEDSLATTGV